jgi:hypothetical protein
MAWVRKLHARFGAIWPNQWHATRPPLHTPEHNLFCEEWLRTLRKAPDQGLIGQAIDWCREHLDFPPTHKQFLDACRQFEPRPATGDETLGELSVAKARRIAVENLPKLRQALPQLAHQSKTRGESDHV